MSRVMNTDLLSELNREWGRVECIHLCHTLRNYLVCIPKVGTQVVIQKNDQRFFEEFVYKGQKMKKQDEGKENDESIEDHRNFLGKDMLIDDNLTVFSDSQILKKDFMENNNMSSKPDYSIRKIGGQMSLQNLLSHWQMSSIHKQELLMNLSESKKVKDKSLKYLMKLTKQSGSRMKPDFGRYLYLDDDNSVMNQINKFYKELISFLQIQFIAIELNLYNSELKVIQELLLFSQSFYEISPQNEMEYAIQSGKDINNSLLIFDSLQADNQLTKTKKVSIVIQGLVKKLQGFFNMEESFRKLLINISLINDLIFPKRQLQLQGNETPIHIKDGKNIIKKQSQLLYCKIYFSLFKSYQAAVQTDPGSQLTLQFFRLNSLLFLKNALNTVNLKFFNTQFVVSQQQKNNYKFKNSNKAFLRFTNRLFKKTFNQPYLKFRLLFANLPIDFQRFIFDFQKKYLVKSELSQQIFSPINQLSDRFSQPKLVRTSDLPVIGLPNYTSQNSEYIVRIFGEREGEEIQRKQLGEQQYGEQNAINYFIQQTIQ